MNVDISKIIFIILGIIIGGSIISISVINVNLCNSEQTKIYPVNFSGIYLENLNQTIYIRHLIEQRYTFYICNGSKTEDFHYIRYNRDCSDYPQIIEKGILNRNLIKDVIFQLNNNELAVTEKGIYCLGKKYL